MYLKINYDEFVTGILPNYWQINDPLPPNMYSMYEILEPFFKFLYYREQGIVCDALDAKDINYGVNNLLSSVTDIAKGSFPVLPVPDWAPTIFTQDYYERQILDFVGGIINFPRFKIAIPNIFTLNDPIRDILSGNGFQSIYPLGGGVASDFDLIDITNQQYARFILARILKFYGNPSANAVINTLALVLGVNLSNINFEINSINVTITINGINPNQFEVSKYFIAFRDNYNEPLFIMPSYGIFKFILNYE